MCVIIHHPFDSELPTEKTLETCWRGNPDGAGIMWRVGNEVRFHKGIMVFKEFLDVYRNLNFSKKNEFAVHFRIATSGGINMPNCHPFPVSPMIKDIKLLNGTFPTVMMHNGVLGKGDEKRKLSDTMLFVINTLSQTFVKDNIENEIMQDYLSLKTDGSRLLIFSPKVSLRTGRWHEHKGCFYSNRSFEEYWCISGATGKVKSTVMDEINYIECCPECGSTEIDYWDLYDENSEFVLEEVYQCQTCYTLIDMYGFRYDFTGSPDTKKKMVAKKKSKGGFVDGVKSITKTREKTTAVTK